jgi:DNA-binding FadR family transcriptional regulator
VKKLLRDGLHERVIAEIGRGIVSGQWPPGTWLPSEMVLVSTLGVSRTALREALRVLGAKGLIEAKQKVGTVVRPRSAWNFLDPSIISWRLDSNELEQGIADLHELRQLIEPLAASLAANHASADDLLRLAEAYEEMEAAGDDGAAFVDPDVRFHRGIIAGSGNLLFASLGSVIAGALEVLFRLGINNPRGQISSLPLHKAVLDAITARNASAARLAMRRLIEDSEHDMRQVRSWKRRNASFAKSSQLGTRGRRG